MGKLTLRDVKSYLRIEEDYDDENKDLDELILFSKMYLLNAGITEIDNPIYRLAQKILIDDRYGHRGSQEVTPKAQSSVNCLILQLQTNEYEIASL
jgi:hypothetical protein